MALSFSLGDTNSLITHDKYEPPENNRIVFYCENKKRAVQTVLSGPISLTVNSKWEGIFNAVGDLGSNLVNILDMGSGVLQSNSIRQSWFGRKMWKGTDPLKFTLPIRFVSFEDAEKEVLHPMMDLLAMVYPRESGDPIPTNTPLIGGLGLKLYKIPGPGLFYSTDGSGDGGRDDDGDRVEISMGSFLQFKGCYITSVTFNIENSFSLEGIPHTVEGKVSFESMDVAYVDSDLNFMRSGFSDPSVVVADGVSEMRDFVGNLVRDPIGTIRDGLGNLLPTP